MTILRQRIVICPVCASVIDYINLLKWFVNKLLNEVLSCMTFVGPCIRTYLYSKTNQMHSISDLFYFGTTLYVFRVVCPSIIRSLRLYIHHHTIQVLWLLASKQPQNLYDIYLMLYVQSETPDDGR